MVIDILYCGVCHSDLHTARNDWSWSTYPIVPGHEIVGRVNSVSPDVTRYKVGDQVILQREGNGYSHDGLPGRLHVDGLNGWKHIFYNNT